MKGYFRQRNRQRQLVCVKCGVLVAATCRDALTCPRVRCLSCGGRDCVLGGCKSC